MTICLHEHMVYNCISQYIFVQRVEMLFTVNSLMTFFSLLLASYVYEFFIVILLT